MAIQIKETPVLTGKDADLFIENLSKIVNHSPNADEKKAKDDDIKRMKEVYERLRDVINGAF